MFYTSFMTHEINTITRLDSNFPVHMGPVNDTYQNENNMLGHNCFFLPQLIPEDKIVGQVPQQEHVTFSQRQITVSELTRYVQEV